MQLMAPLPKVRLSMVPVFFVTSLDLFGPIMIKDTVKQRTKKKVWGCVFNCVTTRALHIDLTEDYGTDAILQTIRRFTAIRGCPSEFRSDQGSQLMSAAKEIQELVAEWKWEEIHDWCTDRRIRWTVVPAEGQHQNGLSESLVKSVKHSILHKIGGNVLSYAELQTALFEIANIINSRPIGIVSGSDPEQPTPITPNDLLLGRSTGEVPQGPFDDCRVINRRFRFVQNLVTEWWESWYQTVLPSLVPSYKWKQRHRNVQVGDVCLIQYKKERRATYRLGRVVEVQKGEDGLVRKVTLKYKLSDEKKFRTVSRPIHGIAVIVPVEDQENDYSQKEHTLHFHTNIEFRRGVEAPTRSGSGLNCLSVRHNDNNNDSKKFISVVNSKVDGKVKHLNPKAAVFTPNTVQHCK